MSISSDSTGTALSHSSHSSNEELLTEDEEEQVSVTTEDGMESTSHSASRPTTTTTTTKIGGGDARRGIEKDPLRKLYNRDDDLTKLIDAYEHRQLKSLLLSVGPAGVGKTCLIQRLRPRVVERDHGFFVEGRYDDLDHPEPFAPWIDATEQLLEQMIERLSAIELAGVMKSLHQSMDVSELQALSTLIPLLGELTDLTTTTTTTTTLNPTTTTTTTTVAAAAVAADAEETAAAAAAHSSEMAPQPTPSSTSLYASGSVGPYASGSPSGSPSASAAVGPSSTRRHNFVMTFGNFLRAVAHPSRPIVWFLDNVHNADAMSLQVLKLLVAGLLPNILAIIAFRPVSAEHPTSLFLSSLERSGVTMVPILPTPIDETSILEWIDSYRMGITKDQRFRIAKTIANGAEGNALAIHLCLSIMNWNRDIVRATGGTPLQAGGDITTLFRLFYQMLPRDCRTVCLMASCMGTVVDIPHLAEIVTCDIPKALAQAEQHGILEFCYHNDHGHDDDHHHHQPTNNSSPIATTNDGDDTIPTPSAPTIVQDEEEEQQQQQKQQQQQQLRRAPGALHNLEVGHYQFVNAAYREMFYSLLNPEERIVNHTAIGNVFRQDLERVGIFRVIVHMALASERLAPKAKELLIALCVEAGRRSSRWSDDVLAAKYLQMGIALLVDCSPKWWKSHTALIFDLYCDTADVMRALGKYAEMEDLLTEALTHANKEPCHRLRLIQIEMQSFLDRMLWTDAIAIGLQGLSKNHESIKRNATFESELKMIRKQLQSDFKSSDGDNRSRSFFHLPLMSDEKILHAMDVMNMMMAPCLFLQGDLVPILAARMVRLSYKHGVASSTPLALCVLGVVLALEGGDIELGIWCSETGVALVEQWTDQSYKGRVMTIHWGLQSRFGKAWRLCQEPLKVGYRMCIKGGDSEFALICPLISTLNMIAVGGALPPIAEAMKSVYQLLQRKEQDSLQRLIRPFYQLVLNLMGVSPEFTPSILTGSIMREDDDWRYVQDHPQQSKAIECCLLWCQAMILFYMHKFGKARTVIVRCRALYRKFPQVLLASLQVSLEFWNAMTSIRLLWRLRQQPSQKAQDGRAGALSSADKKRQHALQASVDDSLSTLQQLASHAAENVSPKVLFVQGQLQALQAVEGAEGTSPKMLDLAIDSFQRSIALAEDYGSIGDKALFCEQAGLTLRLCAGRDDLALDYLEDCCTSYRVWGALIKVNHLKGTVIPESGDAHDGNGSDWEE